MGQARHLPSLLAFVAVLGVVSGCGSSEEPSTGTTGGASSQASAPPGASARACAVADDAQVAGIAEIRVSGVDCSHARTIIASWSKAKGCEMPAGSSRASCSVERYRCLGVVADRGLEVSCAAPGRSISFVAART